MFDSRSIPVELMSGTDELSAKRLHRGFRALSPRRSDIGRFVLRRCACGLSTCSLPQLLRLGKLALLTSGATVTTTSLPEPLVCH
jgi:hypothetical protein